MTPGLDMCAWMPWGFVCVFMHGKDIAAPAGWLQPHPKALQLAASTCIVSDKTFMLKCYYSDHLLLQNCYLRVKIHQSRKWVIYDSIMLYISAGWYLLSTAGRVSNGWGAGVEPISNYMLIPSGSNRTTMLQAKAIRQQTWSQHIDFLLGRGEVKKHCG